MKMDGFCEVMWKLLIQMLFISLELTLVKTVFVSLSQMLLCSLPLH